MKTHVCPWWLIHSFDNSLRRLLQPPESILKGLVHEGDRCLDVGCGFGYLTIPLAEAVGDGGRVLAVDIQREMLEGVRRRAERRGLLRRIDLRQATQTTMNLSGTFDTAFAFWMMHEVPDQGQAFREIYAVLRDGGTLLVVEPRLHVDGASFGLTQGYAREVGFRTKLEPHIRFSRATLFEKPLAL